MSNEKSNDLKKKLGSKHYKPGADIELIPVVGVPEPIRRLDGPGLEMWLRVWGIAETWLAANSDLELLQMTCEMVDERESLRAYVLDNPDAWHERKALRDLETGIVKNLSLLGLTPTDRMKLGVTAVKARTAFDELMARADAL